MCSITLNPETTRLCAVHTKDSEAIPDLHPHGPIARHALLALHEHWNIALFAVWSTIAHAYIREHYRPNPHLSERAIILRESALTNRLRRAIENLAGGQA